MYLSLLQDARFHGLLLSFDQEAAAEVRQEGCPRCGGALHAGHYPRKPRGGPPGLGEEHALRLSFCCARNGCRKRRMPPSLRFLGRKIYFAAVLVLVSAMRHGATPARMAKLRELVGVSRRTVERWRAWWCTTFAEGPFWRAASGRFVPPVEVARLPASLLERFRGAAEEQLLALLRLLAPLTGSPAAVHPR